MTTPDVSVVIPTYNHASYVLETLASVFAQTFTSYEVIVVNDGSPDDTAEVLRPLADSGRINYVEKPNGGQASARNRGLEMARGEYIAFLDDDDLWPTDRLEHLVAALRAEPEAVVAYGIATYFGETNREPFPVGGAPSGVVAEDCVGGTFMTSPGQALIRRSALQRVGGFDPAIWGTDDWDLWIRLAGVGPFVYKPVHTLTYRVHRTNASSDSWRMYLNARKVIRKNYGGGLAGTAARNWAVASVSIRKRFAQYLRIDAARAAGAGKWWPAYRAFGRSVRVWPVALRRPTVVLEFLKLVAASLGMKPAGPPNVCDLGNAPVGHGSVRP